MTPDPTQLDTPPMRAELVYDEHGNVQGIQVLDDVPIVAEFTDVAIPAASADEN